MDNSHPEETKQNERQSPSWIGSKIVITSIFGYGILLSYTWPLGFLPIFSVQSIPAILLSFIVVFAILQIFLICLFWPLRFLFSIKKNEYPFRQWLYNIDPTEVELPEEYRKKPINIPIGDLFSDLIKTHGRAVFIFPIAQAVIVYYFYWYAWYLFTSIFSSDRFLDYLQLLFILFLVYLANVSIVKAKSLSDTYLPLGFYFFTFVALPVLPEKWSITDLQFSSNQFVETTLSISRLGGGNIVSITPAIEIDGEILDRVRLIFFDGNHAWIKPCSGEDIPIIEIVPVSITHYEKNEC